ncbi:MAG: hypothetical protein VX252_10895 [Myxococcota bacterium]|nr:hypothetical protein [Myxococcota bacterium]
MASADKTNRVVLGGIGLGVIALLLWSYCGRVDGGREPAVSQAPSAPVLEPEPVEEEPAIAPLVPVAAVVEEPVAEPSEESLAAAPVVVVPLIAAPVKGSPPVAEAVAPVLVATPAMADETPAVIRSPAPPPVSAPAALEPVPHEDVLIAKTSFKRFTPDVAALATAGLSVGVPIQGDESSLNVLQPCDTPASACGAGADPGQVVGGVNDWTGFVLPGF